MDLNWLAKLNYGGLGPLIVNIIVNNCCAHVLLCVKMLKETETEEIKHFCNIFVVGGISIGGTRAPCLPPWLRLCPMVFCCSYLLIGHFTKKIAVCLAICQLFEMYFCCINLPSCVSKYLLGVSIYPSRKRI